MAKSKILIVTLLSCVDGRSNTGGVDSVSQSILSALDSGELSADFDYVILGFDTKNQQPLSGTGYELRRDLTVNIYNYHGIGIFSKFGLINQFKIIRAYIRMVKPDIIHLHMLTWIFCVPNKNKTLVTLHGFGIKARKRQGWMNNFYHEILLPSVSRFRKFSVSVVSGSYKKTVEDSLKRKSITIFNPIDDSFFQNGYAFQDENNFVASGIVTERKNYIAVVRFFSMIKEKNNKATLHIAGSLVDENYLSILREEISRLGLVDSVFFCGELCRSDLCDLYKRSKFGIFLSSDETFGLVPVEMMASGLKVITSCTGVIEEIRKDIESLGVIVVDDPQRFSRQLVSDYVDNEPKRALLREYLERKFSKSFIARRYENVYRDIL